MTAVSALVAVRRRNVCRPGAGRGPAPSLPEAPPPARKPPPARRTAARSEWSSQRSAAQTITEGDVAARARGVRESSSAMFRRSSSAACSSTPSSNMELMAQAARDAGLDKGPEFERRLEFLELQALRNVYVEQEVVKTVPDAELQAAYQTLVVAEHKPEEQVHARHILVETKEAAREDHRRTEGRSFVRGTGEAIEGSERPERRRPRLLRGAGRWCRRSRRLPSRSSPARSPRQPVQTEFGCHVIKVEEKRMSEPPTLRRGEGAAAQLSCCGKNSSR